MKKTATLQSSLMLASLAGATTAVAERVEPDACCSLWSSALRDECAASRPPECLQCHRSVALALAATLTSLATLAVQALGARVAARTTPGFGLIALQCMVLEYNGFFTDNTCLIGCAYAGCLAL